ncbi:MAG: hypothetical protein QOH76_3696 [Thermoleophilaceae bacterium]|jgi:hypothetical protein|nr:hypothetical protein [Thermoleophilaceae bacterium]
MSAATLAATGGCGGGRDEAGSTRPAQLPTRAPSLGPEPRHRPPSLGARGARGLPVAGMRCTRARRAHFGVHLELFAGRRVVLVAPGIGVAPPRVRDGAYIRGGRCWYPLRTREPTGVVEVDTGGPPRTLGQLFAVWGQPLGPRRMARFGGRVRAYVNGRPWQRHPASIPLHRHVQIVLQVGGYVRPHASYRFPPGL